jgi:hypothetical protein
LRKSKVIDSPSSTTESCEKDNFLFSCFISTFGKATAQIHLKIILGLPAMAKISSYYSPLFSVECKNAD